MTKKFKLRLVGVLTRCNLGERLLDSEEVGKLPNKVLSMEVGERALYNTFEIERVS